MTTKEQTRRHVRVVAGEGRRLRVLTDIVEIKVSGAESGGAYALVEIHTPPLGGVSELHTHPSQETLVVLEGTFELKGVAPDGPYRLRAREGDTLQIAPGAPHSYQNVGDRPGRLLAIIEPPGQMLDLFEALHRAVDDPEPLSAPPTALPGPDMTLSLFAAHEVMGIATEW